MAKNLKVKNDAQKVDEATVQNEENKDTEQMVSEENTEDTQDAEVTKENNTEGDADNSNPSGIDISPTPPSQQVNNTSPKPSIDVSAAVLSETSKPTDLVKIRLRVDHSCCIAKERYEFKAGQMYKVPKNVKNILNRAGLLSPL